MTLAGMLIAGAAGAWLRYEISGWIHSRVGSLHPFGTAVVNVSGAILLALLVACHRAGVVQDDLVVVLGTGFAGAFTTFSTWMVETNHLIEDGARAGRTHAAANIAVQLFVALCATILVLVFV